MIGYMRTSTINGRFAYRAWDGEWYVIDDRTGEYVHETYGTRTEAVAAMRSHRA